MENIEELRYQLHYFIENTYDEELLQVVRDIFGTKNSYVEPKLTQWQIDRMNESIKQVEMGNYLTNEEADLQVEKWLNE